MTYEVKEVTVQSRAGIYNDEGIEVSPEEILVDLLNRVRNLEDKLVGDK
jgi:hypothetical protein